MMHGTINIKFLRIISAYRKMSHRYLQVRVTEGLVALYIGCYLGSVPSAVHVGFVVDPEILAWLFSPFLHVFDISRVSIIPRLFYIYICLPSTLCNLSNWQLLLTLKRFLKFTMRLKPFTKLLCKHVGTTGQIEDPCGAPTRNFKF